MTKTAPKIELESTAFRKEALIVQIDGIGQPNEEN